MEGRSTNYRGNNHFRFHHGDEFRSRRNAFRTIPHRDYQGRHFFRNVRNVNGFHSRGFRNEYTSYKEKKQEKLIIFLGNLPPEVKKSQIFDVCRQYGRVDGVVLPRNKTFGFVRFQLEIEALKALQSMDKTVLSGRQIMVKWANRQMKLDIFSLWRKDTAPKKEWRVRSAIRKNSQSRKRSIWVRKDHREAARSQSKGRDPIQGQGEKEFCCRCVVVGDDRFDLEDEVRQWLLTNMDAPLQVTKKGFKECIIWYNSEEEGDILIRRLKETQKFLWFVRGKEACGSYYRVQWLKIRGIPIHFWRRETFETVLTRIGKVLGVAKQTSVGSNLDAAFVLTQIFKPETINLCPLVEVAGKLISIWVEEDTSSMVLGVDDHDERQGMKIQIVEHPGVDADDDSMENTISVKYSSPIVRHGGQLVIGDGSKERDGEENKKENRKGKEKISGQGNVTNFEFCETSKTDMVNDTRRVPEEISFMHAHGVDLHNKIVGGQDNAGLRNDQNIINGDNGNFSKVVEKACQYSFHGNACTEDPVVEFLRSNVAHTCSGSCESFKSKALRNHLQNKCTKAPTSHKGKSRQKGGRSAHKRSLVDEAIDEAIQEEDAVVDENEEFLHIGRALGVQIYSQQLKESERSLGKFISDISLAQKSIDKAVETSTSRAP